MDVITTPPSTSTQPVTLLVNSKLSEFTKSAAKYYEGWGCFALNDPVKGSVWISCGIEIMSKEPSKP